LPDVQFQQPTRDDGAAERSGHARCVESEFLGCLPRRVADPVQHLEASDKGSNKFAPRDFHLLRHGERRRQQ
jgi:hypothetical protein